MILIGCLTGLMIGDQLAPQAVSVGLPIIAAYFLFTFGYGVTVAKSGHLTRGTRLSAATVVLNFGAMLLRRFITVGTVISITVVLLSFVAALVLFREARKVPA